MKDESIQGYVAAAVRDARGVNHRPGAIAVREGRIVEVGDPDQLHQKYFREGSGAVVERPDHLLMPALVNAHTHLDLTDLGPRPYGGDFMAWLSAVMESRPADEDELAGAVHRGVALCREAGVEFVGDIANSVTSIRARQKTGLPGVSYLECFGLGRRQAERIAQLDERLATLPFETPSLGHDRGVVIGISPHSPASAGPDLFDHASRLSEDRAYRVCSHVAETPEELELIASGTGPWRNHLERLGVWEESMGTGMHPIDRLEADLRRARWLLVHCNYLEDHHIKLLKRTGTSVVYCPVASDYFGHPASGRHRYRDLLEAGVNVCLGTDSILCQPPLDVQPQPMSILAQMRHLYRRDRGDGLDADTLLTMATVNGMYALEFRGGDVTLGEGEPAVFTSVRIDPADPTDPLVQALMNDAPVEPLRDPAFGRAAP